MTKRLIILVLVAVLCFSVSFFLGYRIGDPKTPISPVEPVDDEGKGKASFEETDSSEESSEAIGRKNQTAKENSQPEQDVPKNEPLTPSGPQSSSPPEENESDQDRLAEAANQRRELIERWSDGQEYISIHEGHIGIFRGEVGVGGVLIEETDIPTENLPEHEIDNLAQGIPFATESEKYLILEGFHFQTK